MYPMSDGDSGVAVVPDQSNPAWQRLLDMVGMGAARLQQRSAPKVADEEEEDGDGDIDDDDYSGTRVFVNPAYAGRADAASAGVSPPPTPQPPAAPAVPTAPARLPPRVQEVDDIPPPPPPPLSQTLPPPLPPPAAAEQEEVVATELVPVRVQPGGDEAYPDDVDSDAVGVWRVVGI